MTEKEWCLLNYQECMYYYKEFADNTFRDLADHWKMLSENADDIKEFVVYDC